MRTHLLSMALLVTLLFSACKNTSKLNSVIIEERELDPVEVVANKEDFELQPYNPSHTRINDLLHTDLDVRFDWTRQYLMGKAKLKFKPYFSPTDSLRLDAKGFDIHKVELIRKDKRSPLEYVYNDMKNLYISLDRTYTRKEEYQIYIEYTAKPEELPIGGSAAITSDKGLYFINPLGTDPNKPQQIWTQGETESSSCWFPTIDRPNERTTQEIRITVQDKYKTLSNGELKESKKNEDGTRTDYWVMDLPHAPYLFMMTVGEFAVVKDNWNGMLLEYYVEDEYKDDAKAIFPYTPEMLSFFSARLGVKYPWQKYSQVVVRDYVSGAMENTTAVIFGEFMQNHKRGLIDNDFNEAIVAHEMMHHWFGDLVTCESWSNLPLNESFANYSEYLWAEHKHGRDAADYIRMNEIQGYINQAVVRGDMHPLIFYRYEDKEAMFDAHSYNKGGTILHMLRKHLGDDAFFEGLRVYLERHKYTAVEADELRLAFEDVSGQDLNWFFNQWFFTKGHPQLEIKRDYDEEAKVATVSLRQTQNYKQSTIFKLPIEIAIYGTSDNTAQKHKVVMEEQEQSFSFKVDQQPKWIAVDAERMILCERKEEQSEEEWTNQFYLSRLFQDRYDALRELKYHQAGKPMIREVYETALADPFWVIRAFAVDGIDYDPKKDTKIVAKLEKIAKGDKRSDVRAAAIERLGNMEKEKYLPLFKSIFAEDQSYQVMYAALKGIERIDQKEALKMAKEAESIDNNTLRVAIAELYSASGDKAYNIFFDKNWEKTQNYGAISFFDQYGKFLLNTKDDDFVESKISYLEDIGTDQGKGAWYRYGAANALKRIQKAYFEKPLYDKVKAALLNIIDKETNPTLLNLYQNWKVE